MDALPYMMRVPSLYREVASFRRARAHVGGSVTHQKDLAINLGSRNKFRDFRGVPIHFVIVIGVQYISEMAGAGERGVSESLGEKGDGARRGTL